MTSTPTEPRAWDATPRDRAVTRGLLDGLGRPRGRFFIASIPAEIVVGLLTLGLRPLWIAAVRVDRWRRYEWLLLGEFARWWHARTGGEKAADAAEIAVEHAVPRAYQLLPRLCIFAWALLLAVECWQRGPSQALLRQLLPIWWDAGGAHAPIALAVGWMALLIQVTNHRQRAWSWVGHLNLSLTADGRRAVDVPKADVLSNRTFAFALLSMFVAPFWVPPMILSLAVTNANVRTFRPLKLRLVERMLERMDSSEWQVEYDVESMHARRDA